MKNNKKMTLKTKNEKRRLAFEKRNVKKEQNLARYGAEGGSALVMAKTTEFNRRIIAAVLALVFVLTTIVVGYNFAAKADDPDDGFKMFESFDDSGFVTRKGIKLDDKGTTDTTDDTYDLRLEAYATAPIATKTIDPSKTPLDVVMVMDESSSMGTERDVWTGDYTGTTDTFSVANAADGNHYFEDGDEYYLVQSATHGYAEVQENDVVKTSWTAAEANTIYNNLNSSGRGLYYHYGSSYEEVYASKTNRFSSTTDKLDVGANTFSHDWGTGYHGATNYFVYAPHTEDGADEVSCWHRVYYLKNGYNSFISDHETGYFYTFYYYTNLVEKDDNYTASFSDGSAGDIIGSGKTQVRLLCNYEACACYGALGRYTDIDGYIKKWSNSNNNAGTDGKLYKTSSTSNYHNYLYTPSRVLACQEPNSNYSHTYNGPLYTEGTQLFYEKNNNKVYFGDSVFKDADPAYPGTLYTKETITRLEAQKLAATKLAQKIAETSTEGKDHYIAVVGSKGSDAVKTNLVEANVNDNEPDNSVNDIIDTALDSLTSDGGSIANGLVNARSVFASKTLDPADSRKRIVVIFTDDTEADSNALSEAAKLKDTYNASVYVVGYPDGSNNQSIDDYLSHLSSEYFATATSPIVETKNDDDDKTYHYYGSDKEGILSAFDMVATEIQSPTTKVALGPENSVFRDVISKYFVFPKTDGEELDTTKIDANIVSVSAIADDGNITWGGSEPFALEDAVPDKNLTVTSNRDGSTTIDITGFDYNRNYVSDSRTDGSLGKKIVVVITGLRLKGNIKADSDRRLYSNAIESGIYKIGAPGADGTDKKDADMLFASFPRPFLDETSNMVPAGSTGVTGSNGSVVNKYLTPNSNGKYDLTLEAYTTETNVTRTEKIPTDFVVVVDQSGSMAYEDMPTGYSKVSGTKTIEEIAKGIYYVEGDDGNYYRVYPTRNYLYHYYPANSWYVGDILERVGANLSWFQGESEQSFDYENQFYFRENDGSYRPIKLTIAGKLGTYYNKFSYVDGSGNTVVFNRDNTQYGGIVYANLLGKFGWGPTIDPGEAGYSFIDGIVRGVYRDDNAYTFSQVKGSGLFSWIDINTGMYVNYPMYDRNVGYTELQYRDVNGIVHKLAAKNGKDSWEFCDEDGNALTSQSGTKPQYNNLYVPSGTQTRLEALKKALGDFAKAVADETQDKDFNEGKVDNRIAIVGFSSAGFSNTEVLTKTDATLPEAKNGWSKATADENPQEYYGKALVSATNGDTGNVNGKITAAIDALTAKGGTQPEDGLSMAYEILDKRTEKQYVIKSSNRQGEVVDRNTIVIFFTDGQPGDYQTSDQYKEANEVVEVALPIKKQLGAKLFSIGVFGESDGNPLTYNANNDWTTGNNGEPIQIKNLPRDQWKYLGGWMETYQDGWDYYCLRRQWRPNNAEYTATPNDTIYDYMSVTSSNYPNAADYIAPTWLTGDFKGTYLDATDGVRQKTSESNKNSYYRMASNQDTLVTAFKQAVTLIDNKISDNAVLDDSAILRDILKENTFVSSGTTTVKGATVVGTMDNNNVVTFDPNTTEDITSSLTKVPTTDDNGILTAIDVKGFNYLENYIKYGKEAKDGLKENQGKKLVVTITDVYPTGDVVSKESENKLVLSNEDTSGLYAVNNGNAFLQKDFPTPGITRHQYKLDVGDYNKDATFNVKATIVDNDGNPVNALDDVIVVLPNGSRALYSNVGAQTVRGMKNGDCFYFENVPSGYEIKTEVAPTDAAYIYSIRYDNSGDSTQMTFGESEPHQFDYNDHVINITARLNNKKVTIREQTIGAYGNISEVFDELITLEIPEISVDGTPEAFTYDCTYNGESYTAVFTKTSGPTDGKYIARLSALNKTGADSITITDGNLPMKHDDEITFTVPTGTKVIVSEADTKNYEVVYYTGQDQLNADQITLTDANGTLLDGSFDLEFIPVTGTEAPNLTLSVENGIVSGADRVDLSLYQAAKFTSSDEVSNVVLNLNGTQIPFSKQQDDEDSYYLATYKTISAGSQGSVTITKDDMDILIVNAKSDIPKEGVADSDNHNTVIYILVGAAVLSAGAGVVYVYRKKDEFIEQ